MRAQSPQQHCHQLSVLPMYGITWVKTLMTGPSSKEANLSPQPSRVRSKQGSMLVLGCVHFLQAFSKFLPVLAFSICKNKKNPIENGKLEDSFIHLKFESMKVIQQHPQHQDTDPLHNGRQRPVTEIAGATCKKNKLARQPGAAWPLVQHGFVDQSGPPGGRETRLFRKLHRFFRIRQKTSSALLSESMVSALGTCQFKTANACKCPSHHFLNLPCLQPWHSVSLAVRLPVQHEKICQQTCCILPSQSN